MRAAVLEGTGDRGEGGLGALVEELVSRVETLQADVVDLKSVRSAWAAAASKVPAMSRAHPSEGDPVDLAELASWVEGLQVRYATAGDWLRPCWWRHGFVVEELAALRLAWLAVYGSSEPVDATAGVRWHDEAERCRERIRRTINAGPGCTAVSHKADELVTEDSKWIEELTVLRATSAGDPKTQTIGIPKSARGGGLLFDDQAPASSRL
jgi:hypothetical protein